MSLITSPPPIPVSSGRDRRNLLLLLAGGLAVDYLGFHHPVGPGLAVALAGTFGYLWWLGRSQGSFRWIPVAGVMLAAGVAWRQSEVVLTLALLASMALVAFLLRLLVADDLSSWTLADYAVGAIQGTAGSVGLGAKDLGETRWLTRDRPGVRRVLAGLVIAVPVILVFGALFVAADAEFESRLSALLELDLDFDRLITSTLIVGGVVLVGAGARAFTRDRVEPWVIPATPWRLHPTQGAIVVGLVVALFFFFVVVQLPYLFGGSAGIERSGLTVAQYARRGFFELVTVAALVVGLVLVVDWAVHRGGWSRSRVVDGLGIALIGLTAVVLASAVQRMALYTSLFGLTELRFYTSVFMAWVGAVLLMVILTAGRRDRLALGMFVSALAVIVGLVLVNPDGRIAQVNIDRHLRGGAGLDIDYVTRLGPDAIPVLLADVSAVDASCELATKLAAVAEDLDERVERMDWRSTSVAERRALSHLAEADLGRPCR